MQEITIKSDTILLAQFLKWANITSSGGEAKQVIQDGLVTVNGEVETRRGKQLRSGDIVVVGGEAYTIVKES